MKARGGDGLNIDGGQRLLPNEVSMQIGDNVIVRATGRRARIIEDLGNSRFRVLFYSDPDADALDRDTAQDEDDAGGVYSANDLSPATA